MNSMASWFLKEFENTGNYWESFRGIFPVVEKYIYFNHAAIAPLSVPVKDSMNACNERYCEEGIVCNLEYLDIAWDTRTMAATLINCDPTEITFVKNTTQGLHLAAHGIRWKPGDIVLIPENEFPANVFPWLNLEEKGVETRFIPVSNGKYTATDISKLIDKRTRAVSISAVSFIDGFKPDLVAIGQICREHDLYFIVDAIQALGAMRLDVQEVGIDILAADAHKWLLGPQGTGFAYISKQVLEYLVVENLGYKSMIDESDYLNYRIRLKPDASRFEEGTLNLTGIAGLHASLEMLLSIGISNIEKRILDLNRSLRDHLTKAGYRVLSPAAPDECSGIMSFKHPRISTEIVYRSLFEANIVCAIRGDAVRISPHFYNDESDIRGFIKALPN